MRESEPPDRTLCPQSGETAAGAGQDREGTLPTPDISRHLASISEVVAGITHEINNPLTGVIGFAEMLTQMDVPEDIRQTAKVIYDDARRVAGIVEKLGTLVKGATFIVDPPIIAKTRLPGMAVPPGKEPFRVSLRSTERSRRSLGEPEKVTGTKIMVVDDEPGICRVLHRLLTREGYEVKAVSNAQTVLPRLNTARYDLVLLDIMMPGKSGIELLPEIKASYPDTAVVMVTASADINTAIQCMKQGAYDYLTKPFNLDEVFFSVGRALEKRRLELENEEHRHHLEDKVAQQAERIRASFLSAIAALVNALEAKDKYTSGHSQRVADIAVAIAKEMRLPPAIIDKVKLAGLLHDIGKIGVRESVLNKPGSLSDGEFQQIQEHPEIGQHILAPIADDEEILRLVRSHHERYDGRGYPDHLKDSQILLAARILAVSDAYEAMTSERPYRKAMPSAVACAEIERGKGTQFDPEVADAFLRR